jgi:hypothetical protein
MYVCMYVCDVWCLHSELVKVEHRVCLDSVYVCMYVCMYVCDVWCLHSELVTVEHRMCFDSMYVYMYICMYMIPYIRLSQI